MIYKQIIPTREIPPDPHLPTKRPIAINGMSRKDIDAALMKGIASLKSGKTYTPDEVDAELLREFGI
ncbi:MAG: hypothetical protein NC355_10070 [Blautia sp.]|nr:hypothetical protein [Blautia sp.]